MTVDNLEISNRTQADFDKIGGALTALAATENHSVGVGVDHSVTTVIVIGAIGAVIALAIALWLLRSITRPLAQMTAAAERIAEGDAEVEIDIRGDDEIGRMGTAFSGSVGYLREMAANASQIAAGNLSKPIVPKSERDALGTAFEEMRATVAGMLTEISHSSHSVGSASQQMAESGQQTGVAVTEIADAIGSVAAGAETQLRTLEEAKRVTIEVAAASQASAQDAHETAAAARNAQTVAEQGAAAVAQATEAMLAVKSSSAEITATIRELGEMSEKIGGIVDTITAIAVQTNLLALNAAIEAARAGEHGRGFAVVADEVRKLAEESQDAAATIGGLITQIQAGTGRAVEVVVQGARQTEEGVATVEQAREAFLRIDASVQDVNERVERITSAIEQIVASGGRMQETIDQVLEVAEQSSASSQQVSASTEQTSASTQQIAASAQDLARTAEHLKGLVAQFVLA
jgi:methyl-accepting chemotaxis protein